MIEIYSSAGIVKFDAVLKNPALSIFGSITTPTLQAYQSSGNSYYYPPNFASDGAVSYVTGDITFSGHFESPIIFVRVPIGQWVSILQITRYPPGGMYPQGSLVVSYRAQPNTTLEYRIFDGTGTQLPANTSPYGIQVYNPAGALTFHSDVTPISLVSQVDYLASGQVISNYSATQYTTASVSAYGGGAPFIYANDLTYTDCDNNSDAFGSLRSIAVRNDSLTQYSIRMMQVTTESFFSVPVFSRPRKVYRSR